MGLMHFTTLFRDIGQQETRVVVIPDGCPVPPGRYAFVEMYCSEPGCDCRRVMLQVVFEATEEVLAHISYDFDRDGSEMSGPLLDPLNKQSDLASHLLDLAESLLLSDEAYVAHLQRHYAMFKARVQETAPASDKRHSPASPRLPSGSSEGRPGCWITQCLAGVLRWGHGVVMRLGAPRVCPLGRAPGVPNSIATPFPEARRPAVRSIR